MFNIYYFSLVTNCRVLYNSEPITLKCVNQAMDILVNKSTIRKMSIIMQEVK